MQMEMSAQLYPSGERENRTAIFYTPAKYLILNLR
jgi:hypothetical protein